MSMMADVTDAYEHQYGKRSEGIFSSGVWLMQKSVGAIGILFAGLIVAIVQLPEKATPGSVDPAIIENLVWIFATLTIVLGSIGAWAYTLFPLSQKDHEDSVAALSKSTVD
jgi:GPH family glycoside/pentoside/hexuronide:cation symporter